MNTTQNLERMDQAKALLATTLLAIVAAAVGLYLGNWVASPNWQSAMRSAVLGGLVVVMMANPLDGLLLWMMVAPFGEATWTEIWRILTVRMPTGIPDLTPDRLAVAVLAVLFVAQLGVGKRKLQRLGTEVFMALFCIMVVPAALSGSGGIYQSGQTLLDKFIVPFMVFVFAKHLYDEKDGLSKLGVTLGVIGIYMSLMVFYEHLTGQPLFVGVGRTTEYSKSLRKIISLLGNPAFLGTALGMIVPMALYGFVQQCSRYGKVFYGGLFVTALLGNFLCYNRGAWLALAVALLVLLLERRYRRILLPIILVVIITALVYWQVIATSAVITERLSNVSSVRFRLTVLEVSIKIIRDNLLFGVGLGNFPYYYIDYGGHWETLAYDLPTPHNTYVLVLSTMGLATLTPYLLIFFFIFLKLVAGLRRSRRDEGVDAALLVSGLAVMAVYMVSSAAVDLYINVFCGLVFFLITGTVVGYLRRLPSPLGQAAVLRPKKQFSADNSVGEVSHSTVEG
jgi:hypothetical protein